MTRGIAGHQAHVTAQQHLETLYENHADAVVAYTRRRTDPGSFDVVSEVFMTAWRRLEDIPEEPRTWPLGVARRVLANQRRSQARRAALQTRIAGERAATRRPAAGDGPTDTVLDALQSLSETDREALALLAWEELSHREAARVLGIRTGTFTVKTRVELATAIQHYIEIWHNTRRRHSARAMSSDPVTAVGGSRPLRVSGSAFHSWYLMITRSRRSQASSLQRPDIGLIRAIRVINAA